MKRQKGFSLLELLVSMAIVVTVVATAIGALMQAEHATTAVAYEANTQENLRAGMHFMVRDLTQAGEGIPQGGIELPYTVASAINRPGTGTIFPNTYITLPAITPGWKAGQFATSINPTTNAVLTGIQTDIIKFFTRTTCCRIHRQGILSLQLSGRPGCAISSGLCRTINPLPAHPSHWPPGCFTMPGAHEPDYHGQLDYVPQPERHGA